MRFYPWHIGDYASATAHLSNEEDLAYRRLLDLYYDGERALPGDPAALARRVRCKAAVVEAVLGEFFEAVEGTFVHRRAEAELAKMQKRTQAARANGVRGGRPKSAEKPTGLGLGLQTKPSGNPELTQPKATQYPIPNTQELVPSTSTQRLASGDSMKAGTDLKNNTTPRPDDVSEAVWADWCRLRRAKKAPVTSTALARIRNEASRAGWTMEAALAECVARGWQGFSSSWVEARKADFGATRYDGGAL